MNFNERVYRIVAKIPKGRVMSYGELAAAAGGIRAARAAGYAMYHCKIKDLPCHRVVYRDGSLAAGGAFGGPGRQRQLLEREGVTFTEDGRVDMKTHRLRMSDIGDS